MPEGIRRDLEELSSWDLWVIHLECHRIKWRDRLRRFFLPRPVGFALVATYAMFGLLVALPREPETILRSFGGGLVVAGVLDFLASVLFGPGEVNGLQR